MSGGKTGRIPGLNKKLIYLVAIDAWDVPGSDLEKSTEGTAFGAI
jgi:hypothetical protein